MKTAFPLFDRRVVLGISRTGSCPGSRGTAPSTVRITGDQGGKVAGGGLVL